MTKTEAMEILTEVQMMDDSMYAYNPKYSEALDMAIEALKAQEPRVLRVEKVVLLKQNDVVWLEDYNKKDVIPAIVSRMGPMVICIEFALSDRFILVGYDDYGSRWRCWTSRPDEETRRATPWN